MYNIIQQPDAYSYLSNLKTIIIYSTTEIEALLVDVPTSESIVTLSYFPDFSGLIRIDIKSLLKFYLYSEFPNMQIFQQKNIYRNFCIDIKDNSTSYLMFFSVARSEALSQYSFNDLFKHFFLTYQPNVKYVTKDSPEWLTYLFVVPASIKVKFYLKNGGSEVATVFNYFNFSDMKCYTIDVSFSTIWNLSYASTSQKESYYDIYVEDSQGKVLSNVQRYVFREASGREKYYLFFNQLGGLDTLTCSGELVEKAEITYNLGRFTDEVVNLDDSEDYLVYTQNTGYFSVKQKSWMWNFLSSKSQHYIFDSSTGFYEKIAITDNSHEISSKVNFTSFTFSYRKSSGDLIRVKTMSYSEKQLTITSHISQVSIEAKGREVQVNQNLVDKIECTASSMMIYFETLGKVFILQSIDGETWSIYKEMIVSGNTTLRFDHLVIGSYLRLLSESEINSLKILV